jgi:hypothetical protein
VSYYDHDPDPDDDLWVAAVSLLVIGAVFCVLISANLF